MMKSLQQSSKQEEVIKRAAGKLLLRAPRLLARKQWGRRRVFNLRSGGSRKGGKPGGE